MTLAPLTRPRTGGPTDLYELLPSTYRLAATQHDGLWQATAPVPELHALLDILSQQAELLEHDIEDLWDDFFVDTCADWVVPYIGDLVGNDPLHAAGHRRRVDVARTIHYRRRKGTLPTIEDIAHDVTGWESHAVAFYELLGWTQNLNHTRSVRPADPAVHPLASDGVTTVNLRRAASTSRIDGPFDQLAHTVDVRPPGPADGWHAIDTVGVFVWRLAAHRIEGAQPSRERETRLRFSPLGCDIPLFNAPSFPGGAAPEARVRSAIDPDAAARSLRDPATAADFYGHERAIAVYRSSRPDEHRLVPAAQIAFRDLSGWEPPSRGRVAIDVARGRLMFGGGTPDELCVTYGYGFSESIGGGPYRRGRPDVAEKVSVATGVSRADAVPDLAEALHVWADGGRATDVIQIEDNGSYAGDVHVPMASPAEHTGREHQDPRLTIRARDGRRPVLLGDISVGGRGDRGELVLSGLVIAGRLHVRHGLRRLRIEHCTLVPGLRLGADGEPAEPDTPSIVVDSGNERLEVQIASSVTGALRIPSSVASVSITDSVVDSPTGDRRARRQTVLVSGAHDDPPRIDAGAKLQATLGGDGPHPVVLGRSAATLEQARAALQAALRAVPAGGAFSAARVVTAPEAPRLIVVPGAPGEATIEAQGDDPAARALKLDRETSRTATALRAGAIPERLTPRAQRPRIAVTLGTNGPHALALQPRPHSAAEVRERLSASLRAAGPDPAYAEAIVALIPSTHPGAPGATTQLLIVPGTAAAATFAHAGDNRTTLFDLALESDRPAIAASIGADVPGPPTRLQRTTVLGAVNVRELSYVTDTILTQPAVVDRRQVGCLRYTYVAPGSRTPRRYRCQPDLAVERAVEARGGAPDPLRDARLRASIAPAFTSVHLRDPAYAQLSPRCSPEISHGAESESEMGAFEHTQAPQRESNLRIRLDEYLPFGLDAAVIHVGQERAER